MNRLIFPAARPPHGAAQDCHLGAADRRRGAVLVAGAGEV